uniref:Immunoglobulin V-set domain-containing protein n=1 Tax=Astatotilapia calliptera TaxID=8154 RepID=A0A3P8QSH7_ASTCA
MAQYEILYLSSVVITHFLLQFMFLTDSCCNTVTIIQSYEGYSGDIICSYEPRYQNYFKYICRGKRSSTCLQQALITSDNKQNGRIKFNDDKRSGKFTMTITSLAQSDSGTYLCGVQKNSVLDVFSVELSVGKVNNHLHDSKINRAESSIFVWTPLNMGLVCVCVCVCVCACVKFSLFSDDSLFPLKMVMPLQKP